MRDKALTKSISNSELTAIGSVSSEFSTLIKIVSSSVGYNSERIELTAMYHDIGKYLIPKELLIKPGRLSLLEREVMRIHPILGFLILDCSNDILNNQINSISKKLKLPEVVIENRILRKEAAEIALYHHERWDGTGYPCGLKGNDISMETQIASITDVIDALYSERHYKRKWTSKEILEYLEVNSGKLFSPAVTKCVVNVFDEISELYSHSIDLNI